MHGPLPQIPDEPLWFCIRSQIKHEHIATAHLRKLGDVSVFCPRIRYKKATRLGTTWWTEAMFPNYIFAHFNAIEKLNAVRYAPGVCKVISFGGQYTVVPDSIVQDLREHLGEDDIRVMDAELNIGDSVLLSRGSLLGLSAVITQVIPGKERVRVLMDFLGRMTEFEVGKEDVAPIRNPLLSIS